MDVMSWLSESQHIRAAPGEPHKSFWASSLINKSQNNPDFQRLLFLYSLISQISHTNKPQCFNCWLLPQLWSFIIKENCWLCNSSALWRCLATFGRKHYCLGWMHVGLGKLTAGLPEWSQCNSCRIHNALKQAGGLLLSQSPSNQNIFWYVTLDSGTLKSPCFTSELQCQHFKILIDTFIPVLYSMCTIWRISSYKNL